MKQILRKAADFLKHRGKTIMVVLAMAAVVTMFAILTFDMIAENYIINLLLSF